MCGGGRCKRLEEKEGHSRHGVIAERGGGPVLEPRHTLLASRTLPCLENADCGRDGVPSVRKRCGRCLLLFVSLSGGGSGPALSRRPLGGPSALAGPPELAPLRPALQLAPGGGSPRPMLIESVAQGACHPSCCRQHPELIRDPSLAGGHGKHHGDR